MSSPARPDTKIKHQDHPNKSTMMRLILMVENRINWFLMFLFINKHFPPQVLQKYVYINCSIFFLTFASNKRNLGFSSLWSSATVSKQCKRTGPPQSKHRSLEREYTAAVARQRTICPQLTFHVQQLLLRSGVIGRRAENMHKQQSAFGLWLSWGHWNEFHHLASSQRGLSSFMTPPEKYQ